MEGVIEKVQERSMPSRYLAVGICAACFILYFSWSVTLPVLMAPDEHGRYLVPLYILRHGDLPLGDDPGIRMTLWGTSYGFSVYGSSLFAVCFMWVAVHVFGASNPSLLVIAARFTSVLFSTGTVALCFPIGARLFKKSATTVLFAVMVGFLPQFVFLSSYFNSDTMEIFATAFAMLSLLRGIERRWGYRETVLLGISLGFCALSYYYAYGIILVSIPVYYISMIHVRKEAGYSIAKAYVLRPLVVFISAFAIAGWFFIRNSILYNGDFIGMSASSQASEIYGDEQFKPSQRQTPRSLGLSPLDMLIDVDGVSLGMPWIPTTVMSTFGIFGYMEYRMPEFLYAIYFTVALVGFVSGVISFIVNKHERFTLMWLLALIVIPIILSVYYSWASDYQPQGRYLMAGLIPLMIIVTRGYELLSLSSFGKSARAANAKHSNTSSVMHGKWPNVIILSVAALWICMFVGVSWASIIPYCVGVPFNIV